MATADRTQRVFHVELKVEIKDYPTDTFFSSKKALFDYFGKDLGLSYSTSRTMNFAAMPYENARCIIKEGKLITAHKQNVPTSASKRLTEIFKNRMKG